MYLIFARSNNKKYLIINDETKMETPWCPTLLDACNASYTDECSSDPYYKERGSIVLQTEIQPTVEYIQQHHPELLI